MFVAIVIREYIWLVNAFETLSKQKYCKAYVCLPSLVGPAMLFRQNQFDHILKVVALEMNAAYAQRRMLEYNLNLALYSSARLLKFLFQLGILNTFLNNSLRTKYLRKSIKVTKPAQSLSNLLAIFLLFIVFLT